MRANAAHAAAMHTAATGTLLTRRTARDCDRTAQPASTLQYLSDGLGPDTDAEAFHIAGRVPAHYALPMHPIIQSVLEAEDCSWTRHSLRLVQRIREMGVDAYLHESRN